MAHTEGTTDPELREGRREIPTGPRSPVGRLGNILFIIMILLIIIGCTVGYLRKKYYGEHPEKLAPEKGRVSMQYAPKQTIVSNSIIIDAVGQDYDLIVTNDSSKVNLQRNAFLQNSFEENNYELIFKDPYRKNETYMIPNVPDGRNEWIVFIRHYGKAILFVRNVRSIDSTKAKYGKI